MPSLKMNGFLLVVTKRNNSLKSLVAIKTETMIWRTFSPNKHRIVIVAMANMKNEPNSRPFDSINKLPPHWTHARDALTRPKWKNNYWFRWASMFTCHCRGTKLSFMVNVKLFQSNTLRVQHNWTKMFGPK